MKLANILHRSLIKVTSGKRGWDAFGMPVLKLTTIGRVSKRKRSVMLTSPMLFKNCPILVASKGGAQKHPDWFLNLVKNPIVKVDTGQTSKFMRATIVDRSQRDELWENIIKNFPNYAEYQLKTDRIIPLITLHEDPELNSFGREDLWT